MKHQVRGGFGLLLFGALITQEYFTGFFSGGTVKGNQFCGLFGGIFVMISIFVIIFGIGKGTKVDKT